KGYPHNPQPLLLRLKISLREEEKRKTARREVGDSSVTQSLRRALGPRGITRARGEARRHHALPWEVHTPVRSVDGELATSRHHAPVDPRTHELHRKSSHRVRRSFELQPARCRKDGRMKI